MSNCSVVEIHVIPEKMKSYGGTSYKNENNYKYSFFNGRINLEINDTKDGDYVVLFKENTILEMGYLLSTKFIKSIKNIIEQERKNSEIEFQLFYDLNPKQAIISKEAAEKILMLQLSLEDLDEAGIIKVKKTDSLEMLEFALDEENYVNSDLYDFENDDEESEEDEDDDSDECGCDCCEDNDNEDDDEDDEDDDSKSVHLDLEAMRIRAEQEAQRNIHEINDPSELDKFINDPDYVEDDDEEEIDEEKIDITEQVLAAFGVDKNQEDAVLVAIERARDRALEATNKMIQHDKKLKEGVKINEEIKGNNSKNNNNVNTSNNNNSNNENDGKGSDDKEFKDNKDYRMGILKQISQGYKGSDKSSRPSNPSNKSQVKRVEKKVDVNKDEERAETKVEKVEKKEPKKEEKRYIMPEHIDGVTIEEVSMEELRRDDDEDEEEVVKGTPTSDPRFRTSEERDDYYARFAFPRNYHEEVSVLNHMDKYRLEYFDEPFNVYPTEDVQSLVESLRKIGVPETEIFATIKNVLTDQFQKEDRRQNRDNRRYRNESSHHNKAIDKSKGRKEKEKKVRKEINKDSVKFKYRDLIKKYAVTLAKMVSNGETAKELKYYVLHPMRDLLIDRGLTEREIQLVNKYVDEELHKMVERDGYYDEDVEDEYDEDYYEDYDEEEEEEYDEDDEDYDYVEDEDDYVEDDDEDEDEEEFRRYFTNIRRGQTMTSKVFLHDREAEDDIDKYGVMIVKPSTLKKRVRADEKILIAFLKEFLPGNSESMREYRENVCNRWMASYMITEEQFKTKERKERTEKVEKVSRKFLTRTKKFFGGIKDWFIRFAFGEDDCDEEEYCSAA